MTKTKSALQDSTAPIVTRVLLKSHSVAPTVTIDSQKSVLHDSTAKWVRIDLVDCTDLVNFLVVTGKVHYPRTLL